MDNHYHLLGETPKANISKAIRDLNGHYTIYYNRRHRRGSHLFQGRYKSILIDKENYLLELSRYIHLNPVRANLVKKPEAYEYSSTNRFPPEYLEGYEYLIQDPIKIYDEVKGREEIFNDYIFNNKIMPCYSDRCNYCFMNRFCNELISLKEKIKNERVKMIINKKVIDNPHACLEKEISLKKVYNLDLFTNDLTIDINKFTEYFIKYRYKVKSLRCKECKLYDGCEGINIDYVKNFGFKILQFN